MPPAAGRASAPVAPPPPLPRRDTQEGGGDAHLIEELRTSLAQKNREVEERDARIQGLRIELESLSRRMEESGNEQRWAELQAELNDLRPLTDQVQALDGEAAELRDENDRLRAELQETAVELANARQQGPGSRAEDESHIATLDSELAMVRESLTAAQEKFEEARAGRRNAEELASLQKMRAESFEAQIGPLKADVDRWKAQAAESTGDQISAEEFDAQVAARDEAEEKARALQAELTLIRNQLTKAQADLFVASQAAAAQAATVADLNAKVAAAPKTGAIEARVMELEQQLAARDADLSALRAHPAAGVDDAALAGVKAELEGVQAKAAVAMGESERLQSELTAASAAREALEATVAGLQAQVAGASQNDGATQAAEAEVEKLREQMARLTTANRELEGSASANLKRIQKLMRDIDEARAGAAAGGAVEPLKAQVQQLESEVAAAKAAQARAEAMARTAAEHAPASAGGEHGALAGLLDELNGVVSNFRSDFMAVSDAFEQVRSEDLDERKEGFEQLEESLGACTARSGEIKNLVRDLRARVGVSDE
jgi:chromosome segregation ATPase